MGYGALSITLHERQLDLERRVPLAAERGITLIPGVERTIEGRHVLLLNFRRGAQDVRTFEDLARCGKCETDWSWRSFFPLPSCLHGCLNRHASLFDAIEINAMFMPTVNFNRVAERWAARHGKPLVGNGDIHRLRQLGSTYPLVDPDAICAAIAAGCVRVEGRLMSWLDVANVLGGMMCADAAQWWEARTRRVPTVAPDNRRERVDNMPLT